MSKNPAKNTHRDSHSHPAVIPPPDPMELAKLAAILRRAPGLTVSLKESDRMRRDALEEAMRYYFEAVFFSRELPIGADDLLGLFGSAERNRQALSIAYESDFGDTLKLEPSKPTDEARIFLAEEAKRTGFKGRCFWREARTVIFAVRLYHEQNHEKSAKWNAQLVPENADAPKKDAKEAQQGLFIPAIVENPISTDDFILSLSHEQDGKLWYEIPRFVLRAVFRFKMNRPSEVVKKGWSKPGRKPVKKKDAGKNSGKPAEVGA
jgi:hypothetical protein